MNAGAFDYRVSIHAPAKGATPVELLDLRIMLHGFNPRPREGGDTSSQSLVDDLMRFNPRPREGGDASRL